MTIRGQHHNCRLPAAGVSSRGRPLVGPETGYGLGQSVPYLTHAPAGTRVASSALFVIYRRRARRLKVLDLIFVALTIVFFLIALAYVRGCEKLQ